ncbi:hypothetical protein [Commensalibacter oyaizuii]|uniref:Uncharacterized protein n=1 Tax=Commensalibacter oyaizuii TaxID=3043873 RepID=A0ABT6Q3H0_9PROT|nr:hypothetical protein [Commensalibacter sp. TBRC 16381]MDI2091658.1 hypothetical protein [Commensalibacter sp. TBRC 16381]
MREISTNEIQFVAGGLFGFTFSSLGQSIGSGIGGLIDKAFGGTTALSSSLGQIGQGVGALFDAPFQLLSISNALNTLTGAVSDIGTGIYNTGKEIISGIGSLIPTTPAA